MLKLNLEYNIFNSKKLLVNIDKNLSLTSQSVDYLKKDFEEHKYSDSKRKDETGKWEKEIMEKIRTCPETNHILLQNGKIETISKTVDRIENIASTKHDIRSMMIKIISIGIALFAVLIGFMKYLSNG